MKIKYIVNDKVFKSWDAACGYAASESLGDIPELWVSIKIVGGELHEQIYRIKCTDE